MNLDNLPALMGGGAAMITIVSVAFAVVLVIVSVLIALRVFRESDPKITGSALRGTARILSMRTTGSKIAIMGQEYYVCDIGLRVEVPGRQPYDVTIRQRVHLLSIAPLQMSAVVSVLVDSANPQNVRIDFSQPVAQPQAAPGPAAAPVAAPPSVTPPAPPAPPLSQRLQELETLRATGAVTEEEYKAKRSQIISEI